MIEYSKVIFYEVIKVLEFIQPILISITTAGILGVFSMFKNKIKKDDIGQKNICSCLEHILAYLISDISDKDEITKEDRMLFYNMYSAYKGLGGNSYIDNVKKKFDER